MIVWVTRDEAKDGPLGAALTRAGLTAVHEPVVQRRKRAGVTVPPADWLLLTSAFAVQCVDVAGFHATPVAAVGDATAEAARAAGFNVELVGAAGRAALVEQLQRRCQSGVVCHPRSARATTVEDWGDVRVESPIVYDTMAIPFDVGTVHAVDVVALTSPSAVHAVAAVLDGVATPVASIGRSTSGALAECGIPVAVEAPQPTFDALADAIRQFAN